MFVQRNVELPSGSIDSLKVLIAFIDEGIVHGYVLLASRSILLRDIAESSVSGE